MIRADMCPALGFTRVRTIDCADSEGHFPPPSSIRYTYFGTRTASRWSAKREVQIFKWIDPPSSGALLSGTPCPTRSA
eukprot:144485-Prymnesium_polylepis.1